MPGAPSWFCGYRRARGLLLVGWPQVGLPVFRDAFQLGRAFLLDALQGLVQC